MRSIGKVKIKQLKKIVSQEYNKDFGAGKYGASAYECIERIRESIPGEWFDIWESAWSEIDRLINDEFNRLYYKRNGE
jgi:hypothetical protein